ncbi:MAG: SidE phosphodiesterase domain-containing protein [Legionella sp.]|nr:SidE phosphodiesterase domain-containing protein [Legionella sp.]
MLKNNRSTAATAEPVISKDVQDRIDHVQRVLLSGENILSCLESLESNYVDFSQAIQDDFLSADPKIEKLFAILEEINIFPHEYKGIYINLVFYVCINNSEHLHAFETLKHKGFPLNLDNQHLYLGLIRNEKRLDKLIEAFIALKQLSNLSSDEYLSLCKFLSNHAYNATELVNAFIALKQPSNFSSDEYLSLCRLLSNKAYDSTELVNAFIALKQPSNLSSDEYLSLCEFLGNHTYNATEQVNAFIALKESSNLSSDEYLSLCEWLSKYAYSATKLVQAFITLKASSHVSSEEYVLLCKLLNGHNDFYASELVSAFIAIKQLSNFSSEEYVSLCEVLSQDNELFRATKDVVLKFKALNKAGISPSSAHWYLYEALVVEKSGLTELFIALNETKADMVRHKDLYQSVIKAERHGRRVDWRFSIDTFKKAGMLFSEETKLFFDVVLREGKATYVFVNELNQLGYSYEKYPDVYKIFFERINLSGALTSIESIFLTKLRAHAKQFHLQQGCADENLNAEAHKAISSLIDDVRISRLTYGPLNKMEGTKLFEKFVEVFSQASLDDIDISYDSFEGYLVNIKGFPLYRLSLLLKYTNLSHFCLSESQLDLFQQKIEALEPSDLSPSTHPVIEQLPGILQKSLQHYMKKKYVNMNRFFRGKVLEYSTGEPWHSYKRHYTEREEFLLTFMFAVLLSDAANKLLLVGVKEKENTSYLVLSRGEEVSQEVIVRRQVNPQPLPHVTSFSCRDDGVGDFKGMKTQTRIPGKGLYYPVISYSEDEVLIPAGETLVFDLDEKGSLCGSIVRSPIYIKETQYVSMFALSEAYKKHLSKQYQPGTRGSEPAAQSLTKDDTIARPNHGLAHTYRVMSYITEVKNYFAHHAADKAFKLFCLALSEERLERLRVAAAFLVTGRESEASASTQLEIYLSHKKASASYFNEFLAQFLEEHKPSILTATEEVTRIVSLIEQLGSPDYEGNHQDDLDVVYMHRILNVAHKLDLARCYTLEKYRHHVYGYCDSLSEPSDAQLFALRRMIRYSIDLIKAHGDHLFTDMDETGELISSNKYYYTKPFETVSRSLLRLFDVSGTVSEPERTEAHHPTSGYESSL